MGNIEPFAIILLVGGLAVAAVFVVMFFAGRRQSEARLDRQAIQRRQQEALEAEYDSDTDVLLLRIWQLQGQILEEQREQTRKLGTISTAATVILVLIVLSVIGGCLSALLGGGLVGSLL